MQESLQVGALPSVLNDTVCHPLRSYKPILFSVKRRWKWIFNLHKTEMLHAMHWDRQWQLWGKKKRACFPPLLSAVTCQFNEPSSPPQSPSVTVLMSLALLMLLEIASSLKIALHTQQHHFLSVNRRDEAGREICGSPWPNIRFEDGPIFYKYG